MYTRESTADLRNTGVSVIWGSQRNEDPDPISLGFGDPKSRLIASVLGPTLVITATVSVKG